MLKYLSAIHRGKFVTVGTPKSIAKMETLVLEKYNKWTGIYIDSDIWKLKSLELFTNQKLIQERVSCTNYEKEKTLTRCLKETGGADLLNIYSKTANQILAGIDFTQTAFSYIILHGSTAPLRKDYFKEHDFLQIVESEHLQIYYNISLCLRGGMKRR